jgi:hypothetical protein
MEAIFARDASPHKPVFARDSFNDAARRRPDGDYLSFCVRPAPEFTCHASKATVSRALPLDVVNEERTGKILNLLGSGNIKSLEDFPSVPVRKK